MSKSDWLKFIAVTVGLLVVIKLIPALFFLFVLSPALIVVVAAGIFAIWASRRQRQR